MLGDTLVRRKQMSEPKEEMIEKQLDEAVAPTEDSELSAADFEKVSGAGLAGGHVNPCSTLHQSSMC
jgi:hypothetical protein